MRTSETFTKVATALVKAQAKMGNATKDSKNPFFKSNYADLNAIREVALPVLSEEKLVVLQPPAVYEGKNYIETIIMHESGEFLSSLNEVIVAKSNDPQAFLAAQTYARRGALQAFLNIGAEDDDGNKAAGRTVATSSESKAGPAVAAPSGEVKKVSFNKNAAKAAAKAETTASEDLI